MRKWTWLFSLLFFLASPLFAEGEAILLHINGATDNKNPKTLTTEDKKALNDAAAYLRSLAQLRGRNVAWADTAVHSAASISDAEALKLKVIDIQPDWRYQFLSFLTEPNIAYILMLIAIYGLFFELSNPGAVLPGVAGIISLILCLYAFQLMPINYVGLTLLLLGIGFMIFEVYAMTFGIIGIGGLIAFIIGSLMLFDVHNPDYQLAMPLIFAMSTVSIIFFFMLLSLAVKSHKKAIVSGKEHLIGREGVVLSVMNEQIIVRVLGEIWDARASMMLDEGQHVRVVGIKGLTLIVEPIESSKK